MRVIADVSRCVGAGQCVLTVPALFDQDPETGIVVVLDDDPSGDLVPAARDAVLLCPSQALSIED